MDATAGDRAEAARGAPLEPGVLRGDELVATATLRERSRRAAAALADLGVGRDDTVALLLRNDHPFFETSFAAAQLGALVVPINWHATADEVAFILGDCGAGVLVAHADLYRGVAGAVPDQVVVRLVATPPDLAEAYGIDGEACVPHGHVEWGPWIESYEPRPGDPPPGLSSMIYTSGTTGRPKGVRRRPSDPDDPDTARALASTMALLGLRPGARTVVCGPMYHSAPNGYGSFTFQMDGLVVLQPKFDAEGLLQLIERHAITHLHLVPIMFVRLLALPADVRGRYDLSSLEFVVHAAAPCPPDVKRRMIGWWGPIIHEYYGSTETSAVTTCDSAEWLAHPGTVGRAVDGAVIEILGPSGEVLGPGAIGDIHVRLVGWPDFTYEGRPDDRAAIERGGLVGVGDIGYLDDDGFLHLCDRRTDVVISGGVNIYPAEIEACLMALPGIRDCAVFGVPDPEWGEALHAMVEGAPGDDLDLAAVEAHLRDHLAAFKVPRTIERRDDLPRHDSGKIFKRKLRDAFWAGSDRRI
jgi:long-chain acyl-CoA synthetase